VPKAEPEPRGGVVDLRRAQEALRSLQREIFTDFGTLKASDRRRILAARRDVQPYQKQFVGDVIDRAIANALESGLRTPEAIAHHANQLLSRAQTGGMPVTGAHVRARMSDPVRAEWYAQRAIAALPRHAWKIYAGLLERAIEGDDVAARLYLQRFDPGFRKSARRESLAVNVQVGPTEAEELKLLKRLEALESDAVDEQANDAAGGDQSG